MNLTGCSQEGEIKMVKKYLQRCPSSLAIREIYRLKFLLRLHLTPVRMAQINKTTDSKYWKGCGGRRALITTVGI